MTMISVVKCETKKDEGDSRIEWKCYIKKIGSLSANDTLGDIAGTVGEL